jgi:hypothetical protein
MRSRHTPSQTRSSAPRRPRYVALFQLGVLELERARREIERQTARHKIAQTEERLRRVEARIHERQEALDRDERYGRHPHRRP